MEVTGSIKRREWIRKLKYTSLNAFHLVSSLNIFCIYRIAENRTLDYMKFNQAS